jgi:hypothetical protein
MGTTEERIADLEQEVAGLKRNFVRVMRILDHVTKPRALDRSMIEVCATKSQEKALYDLMDKVSNQIATNQQVMSRDAFEAGVYEVFPVREDDTHSPASFLVAAARDGRWRSVYEYMQNKGLRLPAKFDDLETAPQA